jgi:hypothetical protein
VVGADIYTLEYVAADFREVGGIAEAEHHGNDAFAQNLGCPMFADAPVRPEPVITDDKDENLGLLHLPMQGSAPFVPGHDA